MTGVSESSEVHAMKDEESERPIPTVWRPVISKIVRAFASRDYQLSEGVPGVAPVSPNTSEQIKKYVEDYGAELVELPEQSWESSVCIWAGNRWDALIDLWTYSEGRSDLVLSLEVFEQESGFEFYVYMVYVP